LKSGVILEPPPDFLLGRTRPEIRLLISIMRGTGTETVR